MKQIYLSKPFSIWQDIFAEGKEKVMDLKFEFEKNNSPLDIVRLYKTLKVMADTGAARDVIAGLADFSLGKQLSKEQKRFLEAPIIQHKSGWTDSTPAWMYTAVTADRLKTVLQEITEGKTNGWRVGPAEVAVVTYPATMDGPVRYDLAQVYLWAAANAKADFENKTAADIFDTLQIEPIESKDVTEKNGRYFQTYQSLSSEIRRKVVKEQLLRERAYTRLHTNKPTETHHVKPPVNRIQLDLF